ncbi:MAG: hypothetical protein KDA62_10170 [Planctomycetales bacterium]|nr:hypothetical protein [Planctomycetales bacterium]
MSGGWLSLIVCASVAAPVDFDTQIMPLLTKAGCNAAACHGAASGRGGFKLSLFGGDPAADFAAIARDREGRRVNVARPAASLLLTKPTMTLDHEGGLRFDDDSPSARLLMDWLGEGARRVRSQQAVAVRVEPTTQTVSSDDSWGQFRVIAVFRDADDPAGKTTTEQDVTNWAVFTPDDDVAVSVANDGRVRVMRPGQHTVVVRFLQHVVAARVLMPFAMSSMPEGERADEEKNEEEKTEDSAGASDSRGRLGRSLGLPGD